MLPLEVAIQVVSPRAISQGWDNQSQPWAVDTGEFLSLCEELGAEALITVNHGYHGMHCAVLHDYNGQPFCNLAGLAALLRANAAPVHEFRLERAGGDPDAGYDLICLDAAECARTAKEIMGQHMIAHADSFAQDAAMKCD